MKPVFFAPLEGIGNHIYRGAFTRHYEGVDRFYTPFIDINSDGGMKSRNVNDILPENNEGIRLVPQILTKDPKALCLAAKKIADLGYEEINLNLGCPSPTVTKKGKGAGMLSDPETLDAFFAEVFSGLAIALSVKMRIGVSDPEEWEGLMAVLNRYPIKELTVHPRLMTQAYEGEINEEVFAKIYEASKIPLCLNPGIRKAKDFAAYEALYPSLSGLMIGRGLVSDPMLAEEIKTGKREKEETRFKEFHDDLLESYKNVLFGETPVLFKMKELWDFWDKKIPADPKLRKKLAKAGSLSEYETVVRQILSQGGKTHE